MCNLPYLQKHVYKEKMVKQWGPLLCTLILNCCCWLWKCHHQCACSQQDLLLISQHWLLEVTVKWAMWQYSLITMSMLRQCLDVFLINHYFLLTKLSMFIFFFVSNISLPLLKLIRVEKLGIANDFLKCPPK